LVSVDT
jgi:hypothetical protein